ncbi:glucose 1-dehydrogenase [Paenibacillus flagellatus]|uniref:Glucose dehydrogenase n=1 Tax=Paenibacillus flagellatus TaxID=2211139 RepID=A0A2V5KJK7_9BACL|nr:glucose 1-dehydrogenase [Paenibacillus flagellatus]PYI54800.1 glucose dehydrogenase [Paenibacillus flagellatus]
MKAIVAKQVKTKPELALTDVPEPKLGHPGEALVRVLAVGLDGTDREILQHGYGEPPEGETDLIIGHESLGVVLEAGAESGLAPGDLVTALVRRPCHDPTCVNCRNGRADYCESGHYTERGIKGANGFLCEAYKEDARYLVKIPPECAPYGMLVEPQSIVEKVWDEAQHIQQRLVWEPKTALVLGSGPLGLLAALTCRTLGLETFVWSKSPNDSLPAQLVRRIGASYRPASDDPSDTLTSFVRSTGRRIDLIIECTGYSPLAFEAIETLGPNGVLALLGVTPGSREIRIGADLLSRELVLENKCVIGSVNASRKHFETAIYRLQRMERAYPGIFESILTERVTLDELPSFDFASTRIKAVVDVVHPSGWPDAGCEHAGGTGTGIKYSFSV